MRAFSPLLNFDFSPDPQLYDQGLSHEKYPYGVENLPQGWRLSYPPKPHTHAATRFLRRALLRIFDADLIGVLVRWRHVRNADVIYCHEENEYLAAALLLKLTRNRRTKIIGHTVWLFGRWESIPTWKKMLYRWAMKRIDILVYNALPNYRIGKEVLPNSRHEYIPCGVSRLFSTIPPWTGHRPKFPLILGVGNDYWRDWATLKEAVRDLPFQADIRIASPRPVPGFEHGTVQRAEGIFELCDLYRTAACLIIPTKPNSHACGITTALEAASMGVPTIASNTGGLDSYFDSSQVCFVPPGDVAALRAAIIRTIGDPAGARAMGLRARDRLNTEEFTSDAWWARVTDLLRAT